MTNCVSQLIIIEEQNRMSEAQTDVPYIRKFNTISNKDSLLKKQGENIITAANRQTSINPLYPSGNFTYHMVKH
jgi:hypothetical protein